MLEFAAALGMSTEWGAAYLGAAIELRYRLPRVWARVMAGDLQAWRARRIAEATLWLSPTAAAHVDRHVAPVAHRIRPTAVDRLVEEAAARHDPDELTRRTQAAADRRGVHLDTSRTSLAGTVPLHGELDLPDALALDEALAQGAADLASLGNTEPLDARRATALGEMARAQLPLDLLTAGPTGSTVQGSSVEGSSAVGSSVEPVETTTTRPTPARKPKQVVLHLHLSDAALGSGPGTEPLGRVGTTHTPVTADTIRTWCGQADSLVIKPVIDLHHQIHVNAYEVPDRIREHLDPARPHLRLPLVHPTRRTLRHRPRPTLRHRRRDGHRQPRPAVSGRHHRAKTHGRLDTHPLSAPAPASGTHPTACTCSATTPAPRCSTPWPRQARPTPNPDPPPHTPPRGGASGMSGPRLRAWRGSS